MNQFTFEGRHKLVLTALMVLGAVCLALSWFMEPSQLEAAHVHQRFWTNLLQNAAFFTGIAFISFFFINVCITAYAGWYVTFKRVWEAFGYVMIPGFLILLFIGLGNYGHLHHLYHWADEAEVAKDVVLDGKSGFLNKGWYLFGTLIIVGSWIFFLIKMRSLSLKEDEQGSSTDFSIHRTMRKWSAVFLPIAAFSSAAMVWQWMMSLDSHWYSTMYAWYTTASWFCAAMALTILTLIFLKSRGYYKTVSAEHLHDLGKFMFGFSVFWTYLWFSQFMLIWYANNGEETIYFHLRREQYPVLFYGNLVINFVLPFLILLRNDTKRKYGTLIFASVVVFFGHWFDFFQMVKPGAFETASHLAHAHGDGHGHAGEAAHHGGEAAAHGADVMGFVEGFTIPGILEIGILFGFVGMFFYIAFTQLAKAPLVPKNDPYLVESEHHHVGYGGGAMEH